MAAATVAQNNAPSPHASSAGSSPQSHTSRLVPPPSNAPIYTQQDVVRFIQAALAATRDHTLHSARAQQDAQIAQEERVMKPRVHMYETFGPRRKMIATLELPGLQQNDISITARPNGDLLISGERRPQHLLYLYNIRKMEDEEEEEQGRERGENDAEELGRTVFNELKFGKFQRIIRLPSGTDPTTISASMNDGMLTICWPLPPIPSSEQTMKSEDVPMDEVEGKRTAAGLRSS